MTFAETPCAVRDDGIHCDHWYDGGPCCACKDAALPCKCGHPYDWHVHLDNPDDFKTACSVMEGECLCSAFDPVEEKQTTL